MTKVVATLRTLDLRKADQQPVTGKDVDTLKALLNLFLTAGDVGEDGGPVPQPLLEEGAGPETKSAVKALQTAAHLRQDLIVGPLTWRKLIERDF